MFAHYNELVKIIFLQKQAYEERYKQKLNSLIRAARGLGLYLQKG